jgi:hypothetical protein
MLRTEPVKDDAVDVMDEKSKECIFTVWRADGENDRALLIRAGNISKCINDKIRERREEQL